MKRKGNPKYSKELDELCEKVRELVKERNFETCMAIICEAMMKYPHAPHPHNLLGIVLEKRGDHVNGMKHFLAAWALDPTYLPARYNMDTYGSFYSSGSSAYHDSDVKVKYDIKGASHLVRR